MRKAALAVACAAMLSSSLAMPAAARPQAAKASAIPVANERLWLGSAWYPEQWPESAWPEDLRLMKASGANVGQTLSRILAKAAQDDLLHLGGQVGGNLTQGLGLFV